MMTSEFLVAYSTIVFVSSNSTKNVLLFSRIRSLAPILVKTLSTMVSLQDSAGTKQPICAIIAAKHVYLKRVLLPPILGPVINKMFGFVSSPFNEPMIQSLGINFFGADLLIKALLAICSYTHGCLIYLSSIYGSPPLSSMISGLHIVPYCSFELTVARAHRQSNSAAHYTALEKISLFS
jgi:hypothetical protein